MSKGAFPIGFTVLATGGFLLDCAIKNRGPIATLQAILQNPGNISGDLQNMPPRWPSQNPYSGGTGGSGGSGSGGGGGSTGSVAQAISYAHEQIGKPYCFGGTGPSCYDCSGLIYMAYKSVGINIPRTTFAMLASGMQKVTSYNQCIPGDIIFPYPGHCFLYIGNNQMIEAPHTGELIHQAAVYKFWTGRRPVPQ